MPLHCFYNVGQYGTHGKVAKYVNLKYFLIQINPFISAGKNKPTASFFAL